MSRDWVHGTLQAPLKATRRTSNLVVLLKENKYFCSPRTRSAAPPVFEVSRSANYTTGRVSGRTEDRPSPSRMLLSLIPCKMSTQGTLAHSLPGETPTHSGHTRSTHASFYRALIFFSQHSPLGELGPTQEGAAEFLHIAHVSVVEVVPCLGRDTERWDTTLHSHQVHRWDQP